MPQLDQLSACPRCAEPLETGDLFCGACGTDLQAAVAPHGEPPAAPPNGAAVPPLPAHPPAVPPATPPSPTLPGMPSPVPPPLPPPSVGDTRLPGAGGDEPAGAGAAAGESPAADEPEEAEHPSTQPDFPLPPPSQPDFPLPPPQPATAVGDPHSREGRDEPSGTPTHPTAEAEPPTGPQSAAAPGRLESPAGESNSGTSQGPPTELDLSVHQAPAAQPGPDAVAAPGMREAAADMDEAPAAQPSPALSPDTADVDPVSEADADSPGRQAPDGGPESAPSAPLPEAADAPHEAAPPAPDPREPGRHADAGQPADPRTDGLRPAGCDRPVTDEATHPADTGQEALAPAPASESPASEVTGPDGTVADGVGDLGSSGSYGPEPLGPRCVACGTGGIDDDGYCEHCGHKQPLERDRMERALDGVAAVSDRGRRHHRNEDYFALDEMSVDGGSAAALAVVCDGVSSASRSDEASAAACRAAKVSVREAAPRGVQAQQVMHDALVAAAEAVTALAAEAPNEPHKNAPACTIVSALSAGGILTVGWVGDSRAYWVPDDRAAQPSRLTEDDSWAAQMVAAGLMSEAEANADSRAHAITGWLGADAYELDPHTASFKTEGPGVVVVCTDGLWNYAESAQDMAAAVPPTARTRPLHAARHLVGYALDGGGHDNVTVAVVPFPAPGDGADSAARDGS